MRRSGRICRIGCGPLLYATWTAEFRRRASHIENLITVPLQPPRHNVSHPIPKHTDKSQHRITHHNPRTPKKSPRGVQRGAAMCPFAVFSHFNVIYPLRGRSLCAIQPEAAAYAAYTAEVPQPMRHIQPEFRNLCGIYGGVSAIYIMQQYILQKYTKFRLIYFGLVSNCRYRSIQTQVSFFQLSTVAALYKKGPGVCRGARPCAPLRFSHISM